MPADVIITFYQQKKDERYDISSKLKFAYTFATLSIQT